MHDLAQALKVRRKEAVHRLLAGFDILGIVWGFEEVHLLVYRNETG